MIQYKRDPKQGSTKLHRDKYFTNPALAQYIVDKAKQIIGDENITEYIEPAAGEGVFLPYLGENYLAYDIEPDADGIIKQDFLTLDIAYKQGRCVIGNPPYGSRLNLARAFCNKAFEIADYVAFILPISQWNNTQSIYKFDLVHSEDLGEWDFSDRKIRTCLNIYKRPEHGLNKRKNYRNSEIFDIMEIMQIREIINPNTKRNTTSRLGDFDYDFAICAWGGNPITGKGVGREVEEGEVANTFYIKIKNGDPAVKDLILNADWIKIYPMTATPNLLQWQVYKFVEDNYLT